MSVSGNPKRWWVFCVLDEKKEIEPIFTDGL